jgi:hypothetical protein
MWCVVAVYLRAAARRSVDAGQLAVAFVAEGGVGHGTEEQQVLRYGMKPRSLISQ